MRILKSYNSRQHCRPIIEEFGVLTVSFLFVLACYIFVRVRVLTVVHSYILLIFIIIIPVEVMI
ncbi:hypothetical protein C0J52_26653 [Blattella germanica]|nr:hypothetical protein C0J52_26653 [Blattella germanica]